MREMLAREEWERLHSMPRRPRRARKLTSAEILRASRSKPLPDGLLKYHMFTNRKNPAGAGPPLSNYSAMVNLISKLDREGDPEDIVEDELEYGRPPADYHFDVHNGLPVAPLAPGFGFMGPHMPFMYGPPGPMPYGFVGPEGFGSGAESDDDDDEEYDYDDGHDDDDGSDYGYDSGYRFGYRGDPGYGKAGRVSDGYDDEYGYSTGSEHAYGPYSGPYSVPVPGY